MADDKQPQKVQDIGRPTLVAYTTNLFEKVLAGSMGMNEAEAQLTVYLNQHDDNEKVSCKTKMLETANRIRQVSDGFVQALTVVGSRG